ncbi:unnamed protein product [Ectocarpus sp. 12 AP-2014]
MAGTVDRGQGRTDASPSCVLSPDVRRSATMIVIKSRCLSLSSSSCFFFFFFHHLFSRLVR